MSIIRHLTYWLISIAFCLLIGEIIARNTVTSPSNQEFDPVIGWRYIPHSTIFNAREGFAKNVLNAYGLNNNKINTKQHKRVLVLGDSFVEAEQVPREQNFVSLLDKNYPHIEFINAGRSDLGPGEMYSIYKYLDELIVDEVIVSISDNDVWDAQLEHIFASTDASGIIHGYIIRPPNKDKLKEIFKPILTHSALATMMMRRLKPMFLQATKWNWTLLGRTITNIEQPTGINYEKARSVTRYFLKKLNEDTKVSILYLSNITLKPKGIATETPLSKKHKAFFKDIAKELRINFIDSTPQLINSYKDTLQPPHGFQNAQIGHGHLNPQGHLMIAKSIIDSNLF